MTTYPPTPPTPPPPFVAAIVAPAPPAIKELLPLHEHSASTDDATAIAPCSPRGVGLSSLNFFSFWWWTRTADPEVDAQRNIYRGSRPSEALQQ